MRKIKVINSHVCSSKYSTLHRFDMLQGAEDERSREKGVALHFSSFFSLCVAVAARPEWFAFLYSSFLSSVYTTSSACLAWSTGLQLICRNIDSTER
jgi:hypothetical protein